MEAGSHLQLLSLIIACQCGEIVAHVLHVLNPIPIPSCFTCETFTNRLHCCLECVFIGCWKSGHMQSHFVSSGHSLAMDMLSDEIYCNHCKNYVYDFNISTIVTEERTKALLLLGEDSQSSGSSKELFNEWVPSASALASIEQNSRPAGIPTHLEGLRGMNNLGNTCFMSVILQSFVHNPLLCTYFLSDKHNSAACRISKSGKRCLSCEMDYLFSSMFSGKKVPFSPHQFLFTTWKCSDHLAGYDQQDAHEFLISSLDKVHSHCEEARKHAEANENKMDVDNQHFQGKCRCIIHGTFSGYLRSDVSCESCKATSTAIDPFFDISLDIPPSASADPNDMRDITLVDCLRKFTRPEFLDNYTCDGCKSFNRSYKQLSMRTLPAVIVFHLKRFKQISMTSSKSTKIDTYVEFPVTLDMSQFSSTSIRGHGPAPKPMFYELFCVVNHHGKIDNGHYTCYIRQREIWYKCDDHIVTKAPLSDVLNSRGYMLFYVASNMDMLDNQSQ